MVETRDAGFERGFKLDCRTHRSGACIWQNAGRTLRNPASYFSDLRRHRIFNYLFRHILGYEEIHEKIKRRSR